MKKIIATIAAIAAFVAASAQNFDYNNGIELKEGSRVKTSLKVLFPMQFGMTTLLNTTYNSTAMKLLESEEILKTSLPKSFFYSLELLGVNFSSENGPFEVNIGVRMSFLDLAFAKPDYTFTELGGTVIPSYIKLMSPEYDSNKSKVHGTYIGIPVRFIYNIDKVQLHLGASAEYLIKGYTKYKNPPTRNDLPNLFNSFRATVEGGITYGIIGLYANYGLTPVFNTELSNANTLTIGLSLLL